MARSEQSDMMYRIINNLVEISVGGQYPNATCSLFESVHDQ